MEGKRRHQWIKETYRKNESDRDLYKIKENPWKQKGGGKVLSKQISLTFQFHSWVMPNCQP